MTSVDTTSGDLKITWSPPDTEGDDITKYKTEIFSPLLSTWIEQTLTCDGSLVSVTKCLVPMATLESPPYSYIQAQNIKVRVSALNVFGYSDVSSGPTLDANLRVKPLKMTIPFRNGETTQA